MCAAPDRTSTSSEHKSSAQRKRVMAKSRIKSGGPTRGRKRVRMIGMGSGKNIAAKRAKKRG